MPSSLRSLSAATVVNRSSSSSSTPCGSGTTHRSRSSRRRRLLRASSSAARCSAAPSAARRSGTHGDCQHRADDQGESEGKSKNGRRTGWLATTPSCTELTASMGACLVGSWMVVEGIFGGSKGLTRLGVLSGVFREKWKRESCNPRQKRQKKEEETKGSLKSSAVDLARINWRDALS